MLIDFYWTAKGVWSVAQKCLAQVTFRLGGAVNCMEIKCMNLAGRQLGVPQLGHYLKSETAWDSDSDLEFWNAKRYSIFPKVVCGVKMWIIIAIA